jgi:hypothetical protein
VNVAEFCARGWIPPVEQPDRRERVHVCLDGRGSEPYDSLDLSIPPTKAHPAKAGAAKPRVLASSATLESRRHEGPQDRRAAEHDGSAFVLSGRTIRKIRWG